MKRKEQKIGIVAVVIALVAIGAALFYWQSYMQKPGQLDAFAQCLGDKGAKFYGAYWCPHCQAQKALFGKSKDKLPYVECAAEGKAQADECATAGVEGYPTWIFADSSRESGELTLEKLAQKTGCTLPAGVSTPAKDTNGSSSTTTTQ
jgi:Zn ribbon nucleic-acid-binding protein